MKKGSGLIIGIIISAVVIILFLALLALISPPIDSEVIKNIEESLVYIEYTYGYLDENNEYYESTETGSGIIDDSGGGNMDILTKRHIVDCLYAGNCLQKTGEKITVRTYDGEIYNATAIYFTPKEFDIALLEVESEKNYPPIYYSDSIKLNEVVVAIGSPVISDDVEFSKSVGKITEFKELTLEDGFKFEIIKSDAYDDFEGGDRGLFDYKGNLIGISTWKDNEEFYIVNIKDVGSKYASISCGKGKYLVGDECVSYCVLNEEGTCENS